MTSPCGLLFDFNGTLFFDSEMHMESFREIARRQGLPVPSDEKMIVDFFGRNNETICKQQFNPHATEREVAEFTDVKERLYQQYCLENPSRMHLTSGAPELLDYLKAHRIPYCLATGSGIENIEFYRRYLGLDRWFSMDNIVYTDGTYPGKPAPDIYRLAAGRIGLTPGQCMVFEDGTSGLQSATAAGAGVLIGLWEARFPSPVTGDLHIDRELHNLREWRILLSDFGLL